MSTRYIVDAEGRPVEAVLDIEQYRAVLEARRELEEATRRLTDAGSELSDSNILGEHRRALNMVVHAQATLSEAVTDLEGLEDALESLEDLEATRAHDADTELLESGEADLLPLDQAKREIEEERAKLRSRGEL